MNSLSVKAVALISESFDKLLPVAEAAFKKLLLLRFSSHHTVDNNSDCFVSGIKSVASKQS